MKRTISASIYLRPVEDPDEKEALEKELTGHVYIYLVDKLIKQIFI